MLHLSLAGFKNYNLIPLPDLNDGPRWREMVITEFGPLEVFFTANPYVHSLLKDDYDIRHPVETVPMDQRVPVTGTEVRLAMARGEDFQHLVPAPVGEYLEKNRLAARFREEFGLETLAMQNQIIE